MSYTRSDGFPPAAMHRSPVEISQAVHLAVRVLQRLVIVSRRRFPMVVVAGADGVVVARGREEVLPTILGLGEGRTPSRPSATRHELSSRERRIDHCATAKSSAAECTPQTVKSQHARHGGTWSSYVLSYHNSV